MHKDTITGAIKEGAGVVKKKTGEMTGDVNMEAKGAALEGEGKIQKTVGNVKDAARDMLKR